MKRLLPIFVLILFPITFSVASTMQHEPLSRSLIPSELRQCNSKLADYIKPLRRAPGDGYVQEKRTQPDGLHIDLFFATDEQFNAAQTEITQAREQFSLEHEVKIALIPEIVFVAGAQTIKIYYPASMIRIKLEALRQAGLRENKKKS